MSDYVEEPLAEEPDRELVHWMEPRPMQLGPAGISATAAGAFALGVGVTLGLLALTRWLGARRDPGPPWTWR